MSEQAKAKIWTLRELDSLGIRFLDMKESVKAFVRLHLDEKPGFKRMGNVINKISDLMVELDSMYKEMGSELIQEEKRERERLIRQLHDVYYFKFSVFDKNGKLMRRGETSVGTSEGIDRAKTAFNEMLERYKDNKESVFFLNPGERIVVDDIKLKREH